MKNPICKTIKIQLWVGNAVLTLYKGGLFNSCGKLLFIPIKGRVKGNKNGGSRGLLFDVKTLSVNSNRGS